jgi:hypothetical protein
MRKTLIPVLALVFAAAGADAQNAAPRDNPSVKVGGKAVSIEYGQPALGDRSVDSLLAQLPESRVWRAGSEQVSTFTTEGDVLVGGKKVPAGTYSLYLHIPKEGAVSLLLNGTLGVPLGEIWAQAPDNLKNEPWPHGNYADIADKEVARVEMMKGPAGEPMDRLTMAFEEKEGKVGLLIAWGDRAWMTGIAPAE